MHRLAKVLIFWGNGKHPNGREIMYRNLIRESAARHGCVGANASHIEAWMRLEHGTLDGLSAAVFHAEVGAALLCIDAATVAEVIITHSPRWSAR